MQLRPGVLDFLAEMSELFCVHLYTMGSRDHSTSTWGPGVGEWFGYVTPERAVGCDL